MAKIVLFLIPLLLLSSCARTQPVLVDLNELELGSAHYANPNELEGDGYEKIFAIVDVDNTAFQKAKAEGKAILIQEINGQIHFAVKEIIEFDFPERNIRNAWCPVLFRYRVKK